MAEGAIDWLADHGFARSLIDNPGAFDERRLVADVLAVAAREERDPMAFLVLLETGDETLHP